MAIDDVVTAGASIGGDYNEEEMRMINAHSLPLVQQFLRMDQYTMENVLGSVVCSLAVNSGHPHEFLAGLVKCCLIAIEDLKKGNLSQIPKTN